MHGEAIILWSERTGWGQFYRYDSEGNFKNQITKVNLVLRKFIKKIAALLKPFSFYQDSFVIWCKKKNGQLLLSKFFYS